MSSLLTSMLLLASVFAGLVAPQPPSFFDEDLQRLTGARWKGTLTYRDYRSQKQVSIPSELVVTRAEGGGPSWVFEYVYPEEPTADGRRTVTLEEGGRLFDGEKVVARKSPGGVVMVVTEKRGKDNDRDALFRFTYTLGESSFSILKEVRPEGAAEFFERNRYSWKR